MQRHIRVEHQDVRHVCHVCAKEYRTWGSFQEHLRCHGAIDKMSIKCDLCPSIFQSTLRLRRHMARHQKSTTELQCPHCPKKKPNLYLLKEHIAGRHNYKGHTCRLCEREFRTPAEVQVGIFDSQSNIIGTKIHSFRIFHSVVSYENTHGRKSTQVPLLSETV